MKYQFPRLSLLVRLFIVSLAIFTHSWTAQGEDNGRSVGDRIEINDDVPPALGRTASKVVSALLDGDLTSFRACCSKDGMMVVGRSWDPNLKLSPDGPLKLRHAHSDEAAPLHWVEQYEDFDRNEVASAGFSRIFKQFHDLMVQTYGGVYVSTATRDAWNVRFLGPVISAKVCAGAYLYFYLVKESRGWRVWRMEFAVH